MSGHRSLNGVRSYKRSSLAQKEKLADLLLGSAEETIKITNKTTRRQSADSIEEEEEETIEYCSQGGKEATVAIGSQGVNRSPVASPASGFTNCTFNLSNNCTVIFKHHE
ncbi:hypothetical protein QOT17_022417 [Balamuthia mandrillaris]